MNRKVLIYILLLVGSIGLVIWPNVIFNVWGPNFDKYKFVEEWYKSIFQIFLTLFLVERYTHWTNEYHFKMKCRSLLRYQLEIANELIKYRAEKNKDEYINVLKEFYKTHLKLKDMNIYSYSIVTHTYSIDEIAANILSSAQRFNFNEELYKRYTDRIELVCKALQDKSDTFKCLYPHI